MTTRKHAFIVGLGILAVSYALPAAVVSAQESNPSTPAPTVLGTVYERDAIAADAVPTIPPTNPCPNCGPSGSKGNGTRIWAYTEHHCIEAERRAVYSATYGVGKSLPNPVQFYARVYAESGSIGDLPDQVLALVQPGQQTTTYPLVEIPPGDHVTIDIMGRDTVTNQWVLFYAGTQVFSKFLNCPCSFPATTTTTPPAGSSTLPPASTTPGTPTTIPPSGSSVPGGPPTTGVTVAGRAASAAAGDTLPATGAGGTALFAAIILLGLGAFLLIATRGSELRTSDEHDG